MLLSVEPYMEWLPSTVTLVKLGWGFLSFFSSKELISYASLSTALILFFIGYLFVRKSGHPSNFAEFIAPKELWKHPSSRLDAKYYLLIQPIYLLFVFPVANLALWASGGITLGLEQWLGPSPLQLGPWAGNILYTLGLFVAVDFALFYSHYLTHKYPLLWYFHKVHHSAEALVPFTAMRFHPLDALWNVCFAGAFTTVMGGLLRYGFCGDASEVKLLGNNIIIALSYLTTHNLRHMHIWLHYPRWLNRFLISPAQHQIHHSQERRHWDKNMGYLLPIWDRLFGTLYTPQGKEDFALGVQGMPAEGLQSHRSLESLLIAPFLDVRDAWRTRRLARSVPSGHIQKKP